MTFALAHKHTPGSIYIVVYFFCEDLARFSYSNVWYHVPLYANMWAEEALKYEGDGLLPRSRLGVLLARPEAVYESYLEILHLEELATLATFYDCGDGLMATRALLKDGWCIE